MKRLACLTSLLFLFALPTFGQLNSNTLTIRFAGVPSGACGVFQYAVNNANGDFYDCKNNAWFKVSSAGGSGTVTNIATTSPITGGPITTTGTIACATCGVTGSPLSQFAATTSAQLAGVISDETGSGGSPLLVFNQSPVIVTPTIASFVNAGHDHSNAAGGGNIPEASVTSLVSDLALKSPLASPTFIGVPAAPTAARATNTTQLATTAFVSSASPLATNWWFTANLSVPTSGAVFSATTNTMTVMGFFLDRPVTTSQIMYEVGATADNTAATYDVGVYTGTPGGTCTLLADIGPTAGTTFAPGTNASHTIAFTQGTVTIPAGRAYVTNTTSQTGTVAAAFRGTAGNMFVNPALGSISIATGGTLPPTFTCPADGTVVAGLGANVNVISLIFK